jgi:hypothetical protein
MEALRSVSGDARERINNSCVAPGKLGRQQLHALPVRNGVGFASSIVNALGSQFRQKFHQCWVVAPPSSSAVRAQLHELLAKALRSHGQISLGRAQSNLPDVCRQCREHTVHICSLLEPCRQAMDGEGVSQVMHARLVAGAIMACNSGNPAKSLKALAENASLDGAAVSICKEILALLPFLRGRIDISPQSLVQVGASIENQPPTRLARRYYCSWMVVDLSSTWHESTDSTRQTAPKKQAVSIVRPRPCFWTGCVP